MRDLINDLLKKTNGFQKEAHRIFSNYESSTKTRTISLELTRRRVQGLTILQEDLLEQSLRCIENNLHRSAHVMAWAAYIDFLERKLETDGLKKVKGVRPKWSKYKSVEDLRENVPEAQLLDVARDIGLISKTETRTLHGLLAKRNECAHPSNYDPDLNESLGYVSEIIKRIEQLRKRNI